MGLRNGLSIYVASKLMGHANINDTAKYYVSVPVKEKADAVIALEDWTKETVIGL